jgi:hypothetical protein
VLDDLLQRYHRQNGFWGVIGSTKLVWSSWTGLRVPLVAGVVASAELELEYDGEPAEDADKVDTTLRFKLGYRW